MHDPRAAASAPACALPRGCAVVSDEPDLEHWRTRLLALREELASAAETGDAAAAPVELDQTRVGRLSRMDAMQSQAMQLAAKRRREQMRQRLDAALLRIESGEYGWCLQCGEAIAAARLEYDPTTPLCVGCAGRAGR